MKNNYDVVVVGGGPIGLASAYNCAKQGKSVLLLEQFNFFNQQGSSNDLVRLFRTVYTEDYMADLAFESINEWKKLENDAGESLIWMTGLLNFGDPKYKSGPEGGLMSPIKNLERLGLKFEILKAAEIMKRYPLKNLPSEFVGIFAPENGCINVPALLRNLHRLAMAHGAELRQHTEVRELKVHPDGATLTIRGEKTETINCSKCILACGSYINNVLRSVNLNIKLDIWEMVYEYYDTNPGPNGTLFPSVWFQFLDPTDKDPSKSNLFYGFPTVPWGPPNLVRIAVDNAVNIIANPAERRISPAANDLQITSDFVEGHCVGVGKHPNYCGACLHGNVVDNMYVLDFLPPTVGKGHDNVVVFCAGWAMKMIPLLGHILCDLVTSGTTRHDISHFKITRPGILSK